MPTRPPHTRLARLAALLLACTAGAAFAQAPPAWDIVGLRLGMSVDEARAALAAHAPRAQVTERTLHFTFSDGIRQQASPDFLATIEARVPSGPGDSEIIQVELSPPPLAQRVIRVRRALTTYADPPPLQRMQAQVDGKYGRPAAQRRYGIGSISHVSSWTEAGRPVCGHQGGDKPIVLPPVSQSPDSLRWYRNQQERRLAPPDAAGCSAVLQVNLTTRAGGESVVTMEFEMNAPLVAVPAMTATSSWVASLEQAARKARLASGTTPKL